MKKIWSTGRMKVYDLLKTEVIPEKVVPVLRVQDARCFMGSEFSR